MTTITLTNGQAVETGCWIGGHWGQYGASRLCMIADEILTTERFADGHCRPDALAFSEEVGWLADEAEQALNDATPDGFVWGWHGGEFFLSPICDDEGSCEDETCAHWC